MDAPAVPKIGWGAIVEIGRKATEGTKDHSPLEICGPHRVFEDEDIPPEVATLVPAPCWQIEIGAGLSSEQTWNDAEDLGRYTAQTCKGVMAAWLSDIDQKIDSLYVNLTARIDGLDQKLSTRIDAVEQKFEAKIDTLDQKLGTKTDSLDQKLTARIDGLEGRMESEFKTVSGQADGRCPAFGCG